MDINKTVYRNVLEVLRDMQTEWLSAKSVATLLNCETSRVSPPLSRAYQQGCVDRQGNTNRSYTYKINDTGMKWLAYDDREMPRLYKVAPPKLPVPAQPLPKSASAPTADEIAAAIFRKIQEVLDENKDLKEENRQLRVLAGKHQSKPIPLPDYIAKALVKNGD